MVKILSNFHIFITLSFVNQADNRSVGKLLQRFPEQEWPERSAKFPEALSEVILIFQCY